MPMLEDLLNLTHVPRWCTVPTIKDQSVAEHAFGVAAIAFEIANGLAMDPDTTDSIVMWALVHDGPESYTGDIPSPFKKRIAGKVLDGHEDELCPWIRVFTRHLDPFQRDVVKLADTMEALAWVCKWGNGAKWRHPDQPNRTIEEVLRERVHQEMARIERTLADNCQMNNFHSVITDILGRIAT